MEISKGIKLAFVTAIISGIAIFINKFAVGAINPPLVFITTKNSIVALLIIAWIIIFRSPSTISKSLHKTNNIQKLQLLAIGIIGGALPFYLFFSGLSQIPAINAALIHKSLILWIAILAWPLLKEKLNTLQVLAIIALFLSNLTIGGFKTFSWETGELMVLGATILWAVENVIAKKVLKHIDPDIVVSARMGIGALVLLAVSIWQYPTAIKQIFASPAIFFSTQALWIVATAIILLAYNMTWYRSLKYTALTTAATVLVSSTIITNFLSAIFITHIWKPQMIEQAGIIIFGLIVFGWGARTKRAGKAAYK